jgi:salicylate hydroxylase
VNGTVLIVGGGIGGLAAAFEKSAQFGEIGAGLQVAPNASRALERLGLLDALGAQAVYPQRMIWMDARTGGQLCELDLGAPFRERYGYPYLVMHRSDLLGVLLAAVQAEERIVLEPGKEVLALDQAGEQVDVRCTDGRTARASLVVGADGLWSTVRAHVVDDGAPICSEFVAYRGAIPIGEMSAQAGLDNVVLWTGPDKHLVQYPVRRGELYNQVAVVRSSRYRQGTDDWGTAEELERHFAATAPPVRAALTKIRRNRRWPMYDRLPVGHWSRGSVTLLGDAAHPMLQYLAQGACQALEDAVALADALDAYDDLPTALQAYETARVARTARVQTTARTWGEFWHVQPDDQPSRDAFLVDRSPTDYADVDWLYGLGAGDGDAGVNGRKAIASILPVPSNEMNIASGGGTLPTIL